MKAKQLIGGCFGILAILVLGVAGLVALNWDKVKDAGELATNAVQEVQRVNQELPEKFPIATAAMEYSWNNGREVLVITIRPNQDEDPENDQTLARSVAAYMVNDTLMGKRSDQVQIVVIHGADEAEEGAVETSKSFTFDAASLKPNTSAAQEDTATE